MQKVGVHWHPQTGSRIGADKRCWTLTILQSPCTCAKLSFDVDRFVDDRCDAEHENRPSIHQRKRASLEGRARTRHPDRDISSCMYLEPTLGSHASVFMCMDTSMASRRFPLMLAYSHVVSSLIRQCSFLANEPLLTK